MTDLERLWRVLDGAERLGQQGSLKVNTRDSAVPRHVIVSKLEEELGSAVLARLNSMHLAGAAYDSNTMAVVVAVAVTEAVKLVTAKLNVVRLEGAIDALEAQQGVGPPQGG